MKPFPEVRCQFCALDDHDDGVCMGYALPQKDKWTYKNVGSSIDIFSIQDSKGTEVTHVIQLVNYEKGQAEGYAKLLCRMFNTHERLIDKLHEAAEKLLDSGVTDDETDGYKIISRLLLEARGEI